MPKERPKPFVLPEYCKGCGRCIDACNKDCITAGHEINPLTGLIPIELRLDQCNGCGLCIDACPEPYGLQPIPEGGEADLRQLLDTLFTHPNTGRAMHLAAPLAPDLAALWATFETTC